MKPVSKKNIQEFWTRNVPGVAVASLELTPQDKQFYKQIDDYRIRFEPCVVPLLDSLAEKGELVLEIGCGSGSDSRYLAKKGVNIVSLDLSPSNVHLTLTGAHLFGLNGKGVCADAEMLPFKDGIFDAIYSFGVLHHTPDTQKAINEICRVLKPGGQCCVMLYHKGYAYFLIKAYGIISLKYLFKPEERLVSDLYDQTPLSKMYSKKAARNLFNNFKEVRFEVNTYGGIQTNRKLRWIYKLLNKFPFLMARLGTFLIVKAIKY